nr:DUF2806 domain-containing protein [uncultured Roseateles sp.]
MSDLISAEAAKALSAPLTKLIEVVATGFGRLYEPRSIRQKAQAEADALVILEEGKERVSQVQFRAAERRIAVEEWRQINIESIAEKAKDALPEEVSESPVSRDWVVRFFDDCKDVSDDEMQTLWGRLLAGEVARPGAFSLRTLQLLRNLSSLEANLFSRLCALVLDVDNGLPFLTVRRHEFAASLGLNYSALRRLEDAGLTRNETLGVGLSAATDELLLLFSAGGGPLIYALPPKANPSTRIEAGTVQLTQVGRELAGLWRGEIDSTHLGQFVENLRQLGWQADFACPDSERQWTPPQWAADHLKEVARKAPPEKA